MMTQNWYEILGVSVDASYKNIKGAYASKLRMYAPDTHPEEFKKIRQAYEILINPKSRKEFDVLSTNGKEIEHWLHNGLQFMEEEDYENAIACFKKILLLEPGINQARNYFGLCLSYQGNNKKAISQFEKLIELEPDHAIYHYNLASALANDNRLEDAVEKLRKSIQLDPDNDTVIFYLAELYCNMGVISEARRTLLTVYHEKKGQGFHAYISIEKLLQLEISHGSHSKIKDALRLIELLLETNQEKKIYVSSRLTKMAYELKREMQFEPAGFLTEAAMRWNPDNTYIAELHQDILKQTQLFEEYHRMKEDELILPSMKRIISLYLYGETLDEEEFVQYYEETMDDLYDDVLFDPGFVTKTIRRLAVHYQHLFILRKELFKKVLEQTKQRENL
jgi:tetratricopeptide (TPR) repeat protein